MVDHHAAAQTDEGAGVGHALAALGDFAGEFEKEAGDWNELKAICHDNRLTVFLNGTPINQFSMWRRRSLTRA